MTEGRRAAWPLLLALLLLPPPALAGPGDLLVLADRALTGDGQVVAPAALLVREGRIVSLSASAREAAGARVLDARGKTITPGLVDARSGAGLPALANEERSEATPALAAVDLVDAADVRFDQALAAGITSAAVAPGGRSVIGGLIGVVKTDSERRLDRRLVRRDCALLVTLGQEPSLGNRGARWGTPVGQHYRRPTTRMGVVAELRARAGADFDAGRLSPADSAVIARARRGALPTFFRARTESDIRAALRLSRELGLRPVLVDPVEGHRLPELIAAAGVPAVLGPFYQTPRRLLEYWEGQDLRHANAALLHEAGVEIAVGTGPEDPPASLREMAILAMRNGLPADTALAAITSVPARVLGVDDRIGRLAPGLDGDLVVFSGDPLALDSRVLGVVVEGRILHRDPSLILSSPAETRAAVAAAPGRELAGDAR